jgi:glucosamine--fructose-6-phosphate aminotransferase (isomerizing)
MASTMEREALDCPRLIAAALERDEEAYAKLGARLRALDPGVVITVARGSSDHAADYAQYLVPAATGRVVASLPPSVRSVLDAPLHLAGQLVIGISQGGGSPDIVGSVAHAREAGALTVAVVNEVESPLAKTVDIVLPQHAGPERSLAATKSVVCSLASLARLVAGWARDERLEHAIHQLPTTLEQAADPRLDTSVLEGVEHVYVVSRTYGNCAAREVALKLKETCGLHAEAFSAAEVLHGPREAVDERFLVVSLALPGCGEALVEEAASTLGAQGARVWRVEGLPVADPRLTPLVALQALYPWVARCAEALGRDPDRPRTLHEKVIKTV